jgi:WhiB family transcriptional regulator, redox-sensing transcriptional regulator
VDREPQRPASAPVGRQRLVDLVVFEYRSLVVRRLGVTAEWRVLEWTDSAACADRPEATSDLCGRCPVVAECLAAAVASDDRAEWRGGLNRADREQLWSGLERTYREVRDFELMRLDVSRLASRTGWRQASTPTPNGLRP